MRLLLVEDDSRVVGAVQDHFAGSCYAIDHAPTVADGRRRLVHGRYDAIVLDLTLPDGDGATIADACRQAGSNVPIIMITAKDGIGDRIAGLGRGADDYLCKPFAVSELAARLEAVLRRSRPETHRVLQYADVRLDLLRRTVHRGETEASLSSREVDLLAFFMSHPEQVLPKQTILKQVWGDEVEQDSNILHVYANYLRNKLGGSQLPPIIHTVRGIGYILSVERPAAGEDAEG